MYRVLIRGVAILCCCLAFSAFALDLNEAKQSGLVGEERNGMLGAVNSPTPEVRELISEINARRAKAYASIAERNGTDLETVKKLAGKKAIEKTPAGQYVKPATEWIMVR